MSRRSRDPYYDGLSGQPLPTDGRSLGETVRLMRDTLYADRRDHTQAIAEHLGKSPRQIRRYLAGEVKKPKQDMVDQVSAEMRSDKALRRAAVRKRAAPAGGVRITITGNGGPVIGGSDHTGRPRPPITLTLTPDAYEKLRDAYAEGGDSSALDSLNDNGDQYFEGFRWSKVDHLEIR